MQLVDRPFYPKAWEMGYQGMEKEGGGTKGKTGGVGGQQKGEGTRGYRERPATRGAGSGTGGGQAGGVVASKYKWVDHNRHPAIKRMMREYEGMVGLGMRINLGRVLNTAKQEITNLPVLPLYVENGQPIVCWHKS